MNRRSFIAGLLATVAVPSSVIDGVSLTAAEHPLQSNWLGDAYAVTREAIEDNLYKNLFGDDERLRNLSRVADIEYDEVEV